MIIFAAGLGFEPRLTAPKAAVLPLHHPALNTCRYFNYTKIKREFKDEQIFTKTW